MSNCCLYNYFHLSPSFHSERVKDRLPHSSQIVSANLNTVVAACDFDSVQTASGYAVHHIALRPNWRTLIEAGVATPF